MLKYFVPNQPQKMFLYSTISNINKKIKTYLDPDHNPTDADKKAFELLQAVRMEDFIEHFGKGGVNINIQIPISGLNLLMKAVQIANKRIQGMTKQEIISKCIILINFLLMKGININMQDKSGRTALIAACHWQQQEVVDLLLKHKADVDLCSTQRGCITNPLLAAAFKQDYSIMQKLIVAGANIQKVFCLSEGFGSFKLQQGQKEYLKKALNIQLILYADFLQSRNIHKEKNMLSYMKDQQYQELIDIC